MNATSLLNTVLEKYRGTTRFIRDRELGRRADVSTLNVETLTSYIDNIRTSQVDEKDGEILVKRVIVPALSKGTGMRTTLEAAYTDLHAIALMTLVEVVKVANSKFDILTPHVGVLVALLQNMYETSETYYADDVFSRVTLILKQLQPENLKDHVRELFKALDKEGLSDHQRNQVALLLQRTPGVNWNVYALEIQKNERFFSTSFLEKHISFDYILDHIDKNSLRTLELKESYIDLVCAWFYKILVNESLIKKCLERIIVPVLSKGANARTKLETEDRFLHRKALYLLEILKALHLLEPAHVGVLVAMLQNKYQPQRQPSVKMQKRSYTYDDVGFEWVLSILEKPVILRIHLKNHVGELLKVLAMEDLHVGLRDKVASLLEQIPNVDWNEYAKEIHAIEHLKYDFFMEQLSPEHRPNKLTRFK